MPAARFLRSTLSAPACTRVYAFVPPGNTIFHHLEYALLFLELASLFCSGLAAYAEKIAAYAEQGGTFDRCWVSDPCSSTFPCSAAGNLNMAFLKSSRIHVPSATSRSNDRFVRVTVHAMICQYHSRFTRLAVTCSLQRSPAGPFHMQPRQGAMQGVSTTSEDGGFASACVGGVDANVCMVVRRASRACPPDPCSLDPRQMIHHSRTDPCRVAIACAFSGRAASRRSSLSARSC